MQQQKYNIPILMYHSISSSSNPKFQQFTVPPNVFTEQMAYLHMQHYTPITVTQLARARSSARYVLPERPVVLTFDDGFADFFTAALPILQQYNFVATLYVTTACIGQTSQWLHAEGEAAHAMLSWDELRTICASGIECGGHTHTHPQLDTLIAPLIWKEIQQCKHLLEEQLGQEIKSFAYPYGYQTAAVRQMVLAAGYLSACAVKHRLSATTDDPLAMARLMVGEHTSLEEFAVLLTGRNTSLTKAAFQWYARARTPLWQLIRRGTAALSHIQKRENEYV